MDAIITFSEPLPLYLDWDWLIVSHLTNPLQCRDSTLSNYLHICFSLSARGWQRQTECRWDVTGLWNLRILTISKGFVLDKIELDVIQGISFADLLILLISSFAISDSRTISVSPCWGGLCTFYRSILSFQFVRLSNRWMVFCGKCT